MRLVQIHKPISITCLWFSGEEFINLDGTFFQHKGVYKLNFRGRNQSWICKIKNLKLCKEVFNAIKVLWVNDRTPDYGINIPFWKDIQELMVLCLKLEQKVKLGIGESIIAHNWALQDLLLFLKWSCWLLRDDFHEIFTVEHSQ